jgi:hypothetical protein
MREISANFDLVVNINDEPCTMRGIVQKTIWSWSRSMSNTDIDEKTLEAVRFCFMTSVYQKVSTPMNVNNYRTTHICGVSNKHSHDGYDKAVRQIEPLKLRNMVT